MGIVGRILAPLGLIGIIVAGVSVIRLGDQVRQDEAILEWSNALVSKKVGATKAPKYRSQAIRKGSQPGTWVVSGEVILPDRGDGETRDHYVAVVQQLCKARRERRCWTLESFDLGDEEPMPSVASLPQNEPVADSLFTENAGLAADTMEPVVPLSTAREASSPTNGTAVNGMPSLPEEGAPAATTVEASGEETAVVMIVTDDTAPTATPETRNGVAGIDEHKAGLATKSELEIGQPVENGHQISLGTRNGHEDALAAKEGFEFISPQVDQTRGDELVFLIQDRLNRLGYSNPEPLDLDGQIGPRTRATISVYQEANGLDPDGEASLELLRHIEIQLNDAKN